MKVLPVFLPLLLLAACAHTDDVRDLVPSDVPRDVETRPARDETSKPTPPRTARPKPAVAAPEPALPGPTSGATDDEPSDDLVGLLGAALGALTQDDAARTPPAKPAGR